MKERVLKGSTFGICVPKMNEFTQQLVFNYSLSLGLSITTGLSAVTSVLQVRTGHREHCSTQSSSMEACQRGDGRTLVR